jgi:hypothetical protein
MFLMILLAFLFGFVTPDYFWDSGFIAVFFALARPCEAGGVNTHAAYPRRGHNRKDG